MKRLILLIILLIFPMTSYAFDSAYTGAQVDAEIARGIGRNIVVADPGDDAELVTEKAVRTLVEARAADDDVTLTDVQAATTSDFHNIGGTDANTQLSGEQVDDYVNALIKDSDSVHTRVTITYDDINNAFDFVVDNMNDDVPEAGDFGAATDLDANGALNTGCVAGNELASTAVTPGSYTSTDLTVDADGRITAAANGSGGGDHFVAPGSNTLSTAASAASDGDVLWLKEGVYTQSIPITITSKSLSIIGAGPEVSIIRCTGTHGIVADTNAVDKHITLRDFTIETTSSGTYIAIQLEGANVAASTDKQFYVSNVNVGPYDPASDYWDIGMKLIEGWISVIDGCNVRGKNMTVSMSYGIYLATDSIDVSITNCHLYYMDLGIKAGTGQVEGLIASNNVFVYVNTGIYCNFSVTEPWMGIFNNHINSFQYGIYFHNAHQSKVIGNLIYKRHDGSSDWVGIYISSGNHNNIDSNGIHGVVVPGSENGIVLVSSDVNMLSNNIIATQDTGIWLQSGSDDNVVDTNITHNCGTEILDQGTGNFVSCGDSENDVTRYINKDYSSGDTDAALDFNNGMAQIKLEYLGGDASENIRLLRLGERFYDSKTINALSDFDAGGVAWVEKIRAVYDFSSWSAGYKAGHAIFVTVDNKLNNTTPELAAFDAFVYNNVSNAKAGTIGYDANMLKESPCVTSNNLIGFAAQLASDIDPTSALHGTGFVAGAFVSLDIVTAGVRQHAGFYSRGTAGWKYPFLAEDTDGSTILFSVDQIGTVFSKAVNPYKAQGASPNLWLDETGVAKKGMRLVLDSVTFEIHKMATSFGAWESTPLTLALATGNLNVTGNITAGGFCCDYVFEDGYDLMPLDSLTKHIETHTRLPGITSEEGISMSELYEKTEEQALYILQLHERVKTLEARLN